MGEELVIARIIREVSLWGIGRDLGEPKLHDDGAEESMFDVEFPSTMPPAALEVTAIVDGRDCATARAAQFAVDRTLLDAANRAGRDVEWTINLESGAHLKDLLPEIVVIIGTGERPARDALPRGIMSVEIEPKPAPSARIATWSGTGTEVLRDIHVDLDQAIEDNRSKLGSADGYERHLAVDVRARRASDPGRTSVPDLPVEIDYLWVVRRAYSRSRGSPVVWVTDGGGLWNVNGAPHEAM